MHRNAALMIATRSVRTATCVAALAAGCTSIEHVDPLYRTDDWDRAVDPPPDEQAEAMRAACHYERGALPAETQGQSHPNGAAIPIDHIVVLMQENRSFDHYFQKLPEYGQPDVEVAPPNFVNPDATGALVAPYHVTIPCFASTVHSWAQSHMQVGDGSMDGFVISNQGVGERVEPPSMLPGRRAMGYYDATDLPFYYALASGFAIADSYHASMLGPTWPNRLFFYAGSSYGRTRNVSFEPPHTIFESLDRRGVDYKVYFSDTGGLGAFLLNLVPPAHVASLATYFDDVANGNLPSVAFVNSTFHADISHATWEHPPHLPEMGERFVFNVLSALVQSPSWSHAAVFLTFDEHGGLFDHVTPPRACPPDEHPPEISPDDPPGGFDQYGVRVPMLVVSPFAKRHYVSHHVYDHTSIVRFIEARFIMGALSARDANALAPWDMFDFTRPPNVAMPPLPTPLVAQPTLELCARLFPW